MWLVSRLHGETFNQGATNAHLQCPGSFPLKPSDSAYMIKKQYQSIIHTRRVRMPILIGFALLCIHSHFVHVSSALDAVGKQCAL